MKIVYILDQDINSGNTAGIVHKIKEKIDVWGRFGHEVNVLSLYDFTLYDSNLNVINASWSFRLKKHSKLNTLLRLFFSTILLCIHLKKMNVDIVYMRTPRLYMPFIGMGLKSKKVIMELNSDDVEEWKCNNKIIWFFNNITRKFFYSLADAFVSVSEELTKRYSNFNLKTITIGNGVNVKNYEFIKNTHNSRPQVCFVGSPGFLWHGIDKIEELAKRAVDFDFHFIGDTGVNTKNTKYYGYQEKEKVNEIISKCDVAFSTMSLHVKNMDEASPLKSRQYLALGIPLIYAYNDTDLIGDEDFALKIENHELNVKQNEEKIIEFIWKCFQNTDLRNKARTFAQDKLDVNIKELERLKFIENYK